MTHFEGSSWLTREQYEAQRGYRLDGESLAAQQIYNLFMALQGDVETEEAVRYPAQLQTLTVSGAGIYVVKIAILDDDFIPACHMTTELKDGICRPDAEMDGHTTEEAYFGPYYDGVDRSAFGLQTMQELPVQIKRKQ